MRIKKIGAQLLLAGMLISGSAQAALLDRGGGLIYDTLLNVTWLQNANFAVGSPYDNGPSNLDGRMTWDSATAWASDLSFGGFSDWRLPTAEPNCSYQWDCDYGEIGHLFFQELGGLRGQSIYAINNLPNLSLFKNIQDYVYWTSLTDNRYSSTDPGAIGFIFSSGTQSDFWQRNDFFALAVRDGDVGTISEPSLYPLTLVALAMLGVISRRRRQKPATD